MTQPNPTYADAIERASAALMFREPVLAKTGKTARAIATRVVDALVNSGATVEGITIPVAAQQQTIDVK